MKVCACEGCKRAASDLGICHSCYDRAFDAAIERLPDWLPWFLVYVFAAVLMVKWMRQRGVTWKTVLGKT